MLWCLLKYIIIDKNIVKCIDLLTLKGVDAVLLCELVFTERLSFDYEY